MDACRGANACGFQMAAHVVPFQVWEPIRKPHLQLVSAHHDVSKLAECHLGSVVVLIVIWSAGSFIQHLDI